MIGETRRGGLLAGALSGVLAAVMFLTAGDAGAQPAPPGQAQTQTPSDEVVQAHREVRSAEVTARYAPYFTYPDETQFLAVQYRVLFDRQSSRVRVDRPGYTLVCDGKDVLLVADDLPGRHLRVALTGKLSFEELAKVYPELANPLPPALVMLLSDSPMLWLSSGKVTEGTPMGAAGGKALLVKLPGELGETIATYAGDTLLIDELLTEVSKQNLANTGMDAVRFHTAITWESVNKPVDAEAFELELTGSQEFKSLQLFLNTAALPGGVPGQAGAGGAGAGQPAGAGPGGQAAGGANPGGTLMGSPLPDMPLAQVGSDEKINLAELKHEVVVVEFFASWTRPSVLDLPALSDFKAWCKEQGFDIGVYSVAAGEQVEKMAQWKEALEKTAKRGVDVPILVDPTTAAAMALKLPTVPRTLIVINGRVAEVMGGDKPGFLDDLKKSAPQWLAEVEQVAGDGKGAGEQAGDPKPAQPDGQAGPQPGGNPTQPPAGQPPASQPEAPTDAPPTAPSKKDRRAPRG